MESGAVRAHEEDDDPRVVSDEPQQAEERPRQHAHLGYACVRIYVC